MKKEDPIDRGRMQAPLEQWEREAEERLKQRAAREAAAQAVEVERETERTVPGEQDAPPLEPEPNEPPADASLHTGDRPAESEIVPEQIERIPDKPQTVSEAEADELPSPARRGAAGLAARLAAELVILAAFLLLVCAVTFHYPLPSVLAYLEQPVPYAAAGAALLLLAGVFAARILAEGFTALFTLRRKTAGAAALAFLGGAAGFLPAVLHGAGAADAVPFALSACACLTFETGSRLLAARAARAGNVALRKMEMPRRAFIRSVEVGPSEGAQDVVVPGRQAPAQDVQDTGEIPTGRVASVLALAVLVIAAAAACAVVFLFHRPAEQGALVFAEFASVGAPLMMGFSVNLSLLVAAKALQKRGAALSGYGAVRTFGTADALFLPERLLYPDGQVKICALRPMSEHGVENAVLAAASVAAAAQMSIASAIRGLFDGGETILRPVERLQVIDEMGVEAWVDGSHILLGSRSLLRQKRVDLTGRMLLEVEAKYAVKGNDFVYLVVDDVPAALFVLQYTPDKKLRTVLRRLTRTGVRLLAGAADANINREMLAEQFRLKKRMVRVLPHRQVEELSLPSADENDGAALYIRDHAVALVRAVVACVRLDSTARAVAAMQVIGALANLVLAGAVLLAQGRMLEPLEALLLQLIWALPPFLLATFRRHV